MPRMPTVPLENLEMSDESYSCLIILSSDAALSYDTLRHSVLDLSFARRPRTGEPGARLGRFPADRWRMPIWTKVI